MFNPDMAAHKYKRRADKMLPEKPPDTEKFVRDLQ